MNKNQSLGMWGEEKACQYLTRRGYKILERNHRNYFGELDIIAEKPLRGRFFNKKKKLVFMEVKTRASRAFGEPHEAVNNKKQQKLIVTARLYVKEHKVTDLWQIDVISILCDDCSGQAQIKHIPNAVRYF